MFNLFKTLKFAGRKRIKDRGIKWEIKYHIGSQGLKEKFERELGPDSYHRWEGHDFTTNSNYFVVVGPSITQEREKRFFAGIKKLPDDPHAKVYSPNGEYFITLYEALSHAREKWAIPLPKSSSNYTLNDLDKINMPMHVKG